MSKLLFIAGILSFLGLDQEKLVKTKVSEDITVSLPQGFFPMSNSDLAQRYPSVRQPIGAYTNNQRLVDFSVKESATQWKESDIKIANDFFKASLVNLFDRVKFLKEEIVAIDDKKYMVFEMESRINGDQYSLDKKDPIRQYSYVQYLLINGKTLVFTFTCPLHMKPMWQDMAQDIMQSVKVRKGI